MMKRLTNLVDRARLHLAYRRAIKAHNFFMNDSRSKAKERVLMRMERSLLDFFKIIKRLPEDLQAKYEQMYEKATSMETDPKNFLSQHKDECEISRRNHKSPKDDVHFLFEQEDREVKNLWNRSYLLLIVNIAALGSFFSAISNSPGLSRGAIQGITLIGALFCAAWLQIHRMGRYTMHRWRADARSLISGEPDLQELYFENITGSGRPWGPRASSVFYFVILLFLAAWILCFYYYGVMRSPIALKLSIYNFNGIV